MEAAEVLLQDSWLPERMQRERGREQGVCLFIASQYNFCITAYSQSSEFSCMWQMWIWSPKEWRFLFIHSAGISAKVSPSALQTRLASCWKKKPPPSLPRGYFTESLSSQTVQQQHRSILPSVVLCQLSCPDCFWEQVPFASPICCFYPQLAFVGWWAARYRPAGTSSSPLEDHKCVLSWHPPGVEHMVPAHTFHLQWPQSHLPEEIQLFSKEKGLLLWNWSNVNQSEDGNFHNRCIDNLTTPFWDIQGCESSLLLSVTFRLLSHLLGPFNLCKGNLKSCQRAMRWISSCRRF